MKLDTDRYYAHVYGDSEARFYQDGTFFRADKTAISTDKKPEPLVEEPEAVVVERPPEEKQDRLLKKLKEMHVSKVKKLAVNLAEQLGHEEPVLTGKGVKDKLITYIVENTE